MAKSNPVVWFEIPVRDIERARAFYEFVLGVRLERHDMGDMLMAWFPMEADAAGAAGTLVHVAGHTPGRDGVRVYFESGDMDQALQRCAQRGGKVIMPRTAIGEYGFVAIIEDTEGNRVGLHSM